MDTNSAAVRDALHSASRLAAARNFDEWTRNFVAFSRLALLALASLCQPQQSETPNVVAHVFCHGIRSKWQETFWLTPRQCALVISVHACVHSCARDVRVFLCPAFGSPFHAALHAGVSDILKHLLPLLVSNDFAPNDSDLKRVFVDKTVPQCLASCTACVDAYRAVFCFFFRFFFPSFSYRVTDAMRHQLPSLLEQQGLSPAQVSDFELRLGAWDHERLLATLHNVSAEPMLIASFVELCVHRDDLLCSSVSVVSQLEAALARCDLAESDDQSTSLLHINHTLLPGLLRMHANSHCASAPPAHAQRTHCRSFATACRSAAATHRRARTRVQQRQHGATRARC